MGLRHTDSAKPQRRLVPGGSGLPTALAWETIEAARALAEQEKWK